MNIFSADAFRRVAILSSLVVPLAGCAGGQGDFAPDIFGQGVSDMEAPMIDTIAFKKGAPTVVGSLRPPRTLFYSGAADDPTDNYWLKEKSKTPVPAASRVIPDRRIRAYLHELTSRLLAEAPPGAPEIQVHVLASPSYEAFAREDGDVYISINALALANSEDELAVLLGHETGHLLLNHHEKDRLFEMQRNATSLGLLGYAGVLGVRAQIDPKGVRGAEAREMREDAAAVAAAKMAVDMIADDVVNASWNRTQENDADLVGIDLAVRAGYDPFAMYNGFGHLIEAAQNRKMRLSGLTARFEQRAADLNRTMSSSFQGGRLDTTPIFASGVAMIGETATALVDDGRDAIRAGYQSPEARLERAEEYIERFYADTDQSSATDYDRIKRQLKIVDINNAYIHVIDALTEVADKDFRGALAKLDEGYASGLIGDHPTPRMVEAHARRGLGDVPGALRALNQVSSAVALPVEGYAMKADLEASQGSSARALAAIDKGQSLYGAEAMQPARVGVLATLGRTDDAVAALDQCSQFSAPTLRACTSVAEQQGLKMQTAASPAAEPTNSKFGESLRDVGGTMGKAIGNMF